jgi:UPF0716 family protein affecting phage T7 exclusion
VTVPFIAMFMAIIVMTVLVDMSMVVRVSELLGVLWSY